jgi:hypothetical protein
MISTARPLSGFCRLYNRCLVFKPKLMESLGGVGKDKDVLFISGLGKEGSIKL